MTHRDNEHEAPPDRGSGGDVSTTGVSGAEADRLDTVKYTAVTAGHPADDLDDLDSHDGDAGHAGHGGGGHGGHGDDAAEASTLVPVGWRQLIFPALILLLVAVLVFGPISAAFQGGPGTPVPTPAHTEGETGTQPGEGNEDTTGEPTQERRGSPTATTGPQGEGPATAPPAYLAATRTAVVASLTSGEVNRTPVQLDLAGTTFVVKEGSNLLPDWAPPQDQGIATWISGTYANHVLYLPHNDANAALFDRLGKGDRLHLVMNTGQSFEFEVTDARRVQNGPIAGEGTVSVTSVMAQDRAGVTIFLSGDPAPDRAVVQAEFNGNIQ